MILVVDYNPKNMRIWSFKEEHNKLSSSVFVKDTDEVRDDKALKDYIYTITGKRRVEIISFRILFGGDYFSKPTPVDSKFFSRFSKLTDFFPFYVPSTLEMLKRFQRIFKGTPLAGFFETSFFLKLPDEEKYYALPFEYYKNNKIKKWGFHGIFHEANAGMLPAGGKSISIIFDKQTTVCSIYNKRPLSISLGYTPLEGIMSRTSCGDLDPGIVFYLMNVHNLSIYEIDEMLKRESGFVGLTGYDIKLEDMLKLYGKDAKVDLAFDVYCAQIMKHIGDGISVMGGLDNIIISGDNTDTFIPIIHNVLKKISFLGINISRLPWDRNKEVSDVTSEESKIKAYLNRMTLPEIIFYESKTILKSASIKTF
jgi:acetate kinase